MCTNFWRVCTKSHRSGSCGCEAPSHHAWSYCGQHKYPVMAYRLAEAVTVVPQQTASIWLWWLFISGWSKFSPIWIVFCVSYDVYSCWNIAAFALANFVGPFGNWAVLSILQSGNNLCPHSYFYVTLLDKGLTNFARSIIADLIIYVQTGMTLTWTYNWHTMWK